VKGAVQKKRGTTTARDGSNLNQTNEKTCYLKEKGGGWRKGGKGPKMTGKKGTMQKMPNERGGTLEPKNAVLLGRGRAASWKRNPWVCIMGRGGWARLGAGPSGSSSRPPRRSDIRRFEGKKGVLKGSSTKEGGGSPKEKSHRGELRKK